MNRKVLLTIMALILSFTAVQAQDIFEKLSNHDDITTVYISKSLLSMMPSKGADMMGGVNIKNLASKLEQLEVYNSENKGASDMMRNEIKALVKTKTYETLMAVKDKGDNVTFYAHKENDKFKDLVMFVNEPNACTIIRITGNFTAEDIQGVMDSTK
ncbi:MAG: DUF4252 domain-containing protein [Dysgonomonas sp.]|nr:DUF4252 domain-containing protein [Dysgonomonas sp.]